MRYITLHKLLNDDASPRLLKDLKEYDYIFEFSLKLFYIKY